MQRLYVVEATKTLQGLVKDNARIIVGNFATGKSISDFIEALGNSNIAAFKVGIGGGSACTTRIVTGCGIPTFFSILDCRVARPPIIADGGIRNSGTLVKRIGLEHQQ